MRVKPGLLDFKTYLVMGTLIKNKAHPLFLLDILVEGGVMQLILRS